MGMLAWYEQTSNPYDNATCESFPKIAPREEITRPHRDFEDLQKRAEEFIEESNCATTVQQQI